jgi:endonuclease/exonuclease/phosphatase (EEP) superfamily protein YafD
VRFLIEAAHRPQGPWRRLTVLLLRLVALGLVCLVAGRFAGFEKGSLWSLAMAVLPLTLSLAYPLLMAAVLMRQRGLSLLALLLAGVHVLLVAPSTGVSGAACEGTALRVVGANILKSNPVPDQAARTLRALHPDVLILPELSEQVRTGLAGAGLFDDLPHLVWRGDSGLKRPVGAGPEAPTGLASRLPVAEESVRFIENQHEPRATVEIGGVRVRVLGVHPLPPLAGQGEEWRRSLVKLDGEIESGADVQVAAGDFNSGRDFKTFRTLLDDGVRDAHEQVGRGLARTWPHGRAVPPILHLDHVLVRDGAVGVVSVCSVREVVVPGSDHLAVVADLAVRRR